MKTKYRNFFSACVLYCEGFIQEYMPNLNSMHNSKYTNSPTDLKDA